MVIVRQLRDAGFEGRIVMGGHFATLKRRVIARGGVASGGWRVATAPMPA